MGEVVNLRRARKRADRDAAEARAQENRVKHGLGKAEKIRQRAERGAEARRLDGHQLGAGNAGLPAEPGPDPLR